MAQPLQSLLPRRGKYHQKRMRDSTNEPWWERPRLRGRCSWQLQLQRIAPMIVQQCRLTRTRAPAIRTVRRDGATVAAVRRPRPRSRPRTEPLGPVDFSSS